MPIRGGNQLNRPNKVFADIGTNGFEAFDLDIQNSPDFFGDIL